MRDPVPVRCGECGAPPGAQCESWCSSWSTRPKTNWVSIRPGMSGRRVTVPATRGDVNASVD